MRVLRTYPPHFNQLSKVFPIKGKPGIIYAYGNTLYNPSGVALSPWIIAHEETHGQRQGDMGVGAWWDRYMFEALFRTQEEVLAHRVEWLTAKVMLPPKGAERYLKTMVDRLSGPLYGLGMSKNNAEYLIRSKQ